MPAFQLETGQNVCDSIVIYMKRYLYSYLLLAAFVLGNSAQTSQVATSDAHLESLKKHVAYLASEKLEGRRTGEPGAALAANYIAENFAKIGLKPGVGCKEWCSRLYAAFPVCDGC